MTTCIADRVADDEVIHRLFDLPLTRLNVGVFGDGPPVIIVPATISLIDDWEPLIRFVGQRYRVHFFELPGYGGSEPFSAPFSSLLVAETIGHLADAIGAERFSLLGFSFGGALTMRSLQLHADRIDRVCLLAPFTGCECLRHSRVKLLAVQAALFTVRSRAARQGLAGALRSRTGTAALAWFMKTAGKFETTADLRRRLESFTLDSLDTLIAQVDEILTISGDELAGPYEVPCLFGMSVNDPLLDFGVSERFVHHNFTNLTEERWTMPWHAAPEPFTVEDYEREYHVLLEWE
ncbi:MAG: alpha/beta hydrolase [Coriobacteriia bacterium]|nr:alpha/beta hydrolase [Coriobacteriia bacterium]